MKMGIYKFNTLYMIDHYMSILCKILKSFGHDVHIEKDAECCYDDDVTFLLLCADYMINRSKNDFQKIYGKSKCVVLIQTEQLHKNKIYYEGFLDEQKYVDCIWELMPDMYDEVGAEYYIKPVIVAPFGYHPDMTYEIDFGSVLDFNSGLFYAEQIDFNNIGSCGARAPFFEALKNKMYEGWMGYKYLNNKHLGNAVKKSNICLHVHSYGQGCCLPSFKIIGTFISNSGFVLSQRTKYPFLEEGRHIVYFDDVDDMCNKIEYYLKNNNEANDISKNAFEHVRTNLLWEDSIKKVLDFIGNGLNI